MMKIAVLRGVRNFVIEDAPVPTLGPSEVLVRVKACGVCTSELYTWNGKIKNAQFPQYPGHEPSGMIENVGENVKGLREGQHVTLWSEGRGFSEYLKVPPNYVVPIPDDLPFELALGEPVACAMNGVRRSDVQLGDTVVVIGAGFMGALMIQGLVLRGPSKLIAIDLEEDRLELARKFGADVTLNSKKTDVLKEVMNLTNGVGADVVVEATGHQEPIDLGTAMVRIRGRLIVFGYHVGAPRQVDMSTWNWKGLDVINAHERAPEIYMKGMRIGVSLMTKGKITTKPLVTHVFPLDKVNDAFDANDTKPKGFIKSVVTC